MIDRMSPDSFGRMVVLLITALLVLLSGCAPLKTTVYADEQIRSYLKSLPNRQDYPLARNLTWKYHYTAGTGSSESAWFVADGKLIRGARAMAGVQMYAAQPTTSGMNMSEVYTQKGREASAKGRYGDAQMYHGLSEAALQTQIASERMAAGMALGGAIQNLGAALLDAVIVEQGHNTAKYVRERSPQVVGEQAPDGTVLELFLRAQRLDYVDSKPHMTTMKWETVATLKDADGKIWRSAASYTTYLVFTSASEPQPMPAKFNDSRYVLMDVGNWVPAGGVNEYMPSVREIARMPGGAVELSVSAVHAVEGLYEQIGLAKRNK